MNTESPDTATIAAGHGTTRRGRLSPVASRVCVALVFALTGRVGLLAHDPGLSSIELRVGPHDITAILSLAKSDVEAIGGRDAVATLAANSVEIWIEDRRLSGSLTEVSADQSGGVRAQLVFPGTARSRLVVRSYVPARLARGHRQLASLRDQHGTVLAERMLDAVSNEVGAAIDGNPNGAGATVLRFFGLGVRHIVTGYDHLLFLAGVLIVVRCWRDAVQTVTSFTVAHSITLALAATGIVSVPSGVVEPLIAASIVYVGVENLFLQHSETRRWKLTFAFGLVHGLGFASALRDVGIGNTAATMILPLGSFNGGVEAGQIAVALLLIPFFRSLNLAPRLRLASAGSWVIAAAGGYWFVERVM